ncbi:hypothetical protein ANO14919_084310 [Xylariales sp. No.14919]|nr:hypothetical protein ANO14919_084310 [Xylariales sp. No.14919]
MGPVRATMRQLSRSEESEYHDRMAGGYGRGAQTAKEEATVD